MYLFSSFLAFICPESGFFDEKISGKIRKSQLFYYWHAGFVTTDVFGYFPVVKIYIAMENAALKWLFLPSIFPLPAG